MSNPRWIDFSLGLAALVVLVAAFVACDDYVRANTPLPIRLFNVTDDEAEFIKEMLDQMHYSARSRIAMIVLVNEIDKKSGGQCFVNTDSNSSVILIERTYLKTTVLWHEAIHAHMNNISSRALEEWRALGIGVRLPYLDEKWVEEGRASYPQGGIICAYGRKNEYEDIATWGEALYSKLGGVSSPLDKQFDSDNPIYRKILAWFLKWDFISQAQYDTLCSQLFK